MALRLASVVTLLVILTSGCATSNQATESTTFKSSTTAAAGIPTTTTNMASDKAQAQKLVIVSADLPGKWDEQPATPPQAQDIELDNQINACVGMPPDAQEYETHAYGDSFSQGDSIDLDSQVAVTKTLQLAQQNLTSSSDPKNFPCLEKVLAASLQSSAGQGNPVTSKITPVPGVTLKRNQSALRVTSTANINGETGTMWVDMLDANDGRFMTLITISAYDAPPPASLDQAVLNAAQKHIVALNTSA